jgi:uncharacterized membrane protein
MQMEEFKEVTCANNNLATDKSGEERSFDRISKIVIFVIFVLILIVVSFYTYTFWGSGYSNKEYFGLFGDFLGGILNPILTFSTVVLLIFSIKYQLAELKLTREEIGIQTSEQMKNNNIQLQVAKATENSLVLPDLISAIKEKKEQLNNFLAVRVDYGAQYTITASDSDKELKVLAVELRKANNPSKFKSLKELIKSKLEGDCDELSVGDNLKNSFLDFCGDYRSINTLLDEYLDKGGSLFLANDFSQNLGRLFFVFSFSNDEKVVEKAEEMLNLCHKYIHEYHKNLEA